MLVVYLAHAIVNINCLGDISRLDLCNCRLECVTAKKVELVEVHGLFSQSAFGPFPLLGDLAIFTD